MLLFVCCSSLVCFPNDDLSSLSLLEKLEIGEEKPQLTSPSDEIWIWNFVKILQKGENFLEILDKLQLKLKQFSSKIILSRSRINFWENFEKNLLKLQESFREWMLQKC